MKIIFYGYFKLLQGNTKKLHQPSPPFIQNENQHLRINMTYGTLKECKIHKHYGLKLDTTSLVY